MIKYLCECLILLHQHSLPCNINLTFPIKIRNHKTSKSQISMIYLFKRAICVYIEIWTHGGKPSSKCCILYDLLIWHNIIVQGFQRPETVYHMVSVVRLQTQRSVVQCEYWHTGWCRHALYVFQFRNAIVVEIKNLKVRQSCPKLMSWEFGYLFTVKKSVALDINIEFWGLHIM